MRRKALREEHRAVRTLQYWSRRLQADQRWHMLNAPGAVPRAYLRIIIPSVPSAALPTKGPWKRLAREVES